MTENIFLVYTVLPKTINYIIKNCKLFFIKLKTMIVVKFKTARYNNNLGNEISKYLNYFPTISF